jgi:transcriptional regulator with XRE-family HTH domain
MEFGELLRGLRADAGLTQLELATAMEVSERTVRSWETGKPPAGSKARRIAEVLGLTGTQYARFTALASGSDPGDMPQAIAAATRTLPRDIASFTGRVPELEALTAAVDSAAAVGGVPLVCVIHGMTGVGKTKLAVHFAHLIADRYPDGQFSWICTATAPSGARLTRRMS